MVMTLHSPYTDPSPIVILYIAVEMDVFFPTSLTKEVANLLLDGRRDETRAIAELIIVGLAMTGNEIGAHKWFYLAWHIGIEDVHHTSCKLHLC